MFKKMSQLGTPITRDAMKNITGALAAFPEWTCYYNGSSVQMCFAFDPAAACGYDYCDTTGGSCSFIEACKAV